MTRHEIILILERYDVDLKTHNVIADKILALSGVVGRRELLVCSICNENEKQEANDPYCIYCELEIEGQVN